MQQHKYTILVWDLIDNVSDGGDTRTGKVVVCGLFLHL